MTRGAWVLAVGALQASCTCLAPPLPSERAESHEVESTPDATVEPAEPAAPPATARDPVPPLPDPLPGKRQDVTKLVGGSSRAAVGDVDGDGRSELILAGAERLRILTPAGRELASTNAPGGAQVLTAADIDGDRRAEVLAGWGQSAQHREAKARISVFRLAHGGLSEDSVPIPETTRQDVAAVLPAGESGTPALVVAAFESKYLVGSALAEKGPSGWNARGLGKIRMATSYARGDVDGDREPDLVVGRLYGDDREHDGDAFVLARDGRRTAVPTTRGVRGLAVADVDGDGVGEIFLGDGWHRSYAASARGLLTWARWRDGSFRSELIEDTPGQYAIFRILPADVDGDGRAEIVTQGSDYVRVYRRVASRWQALTIAGRCRDVAVGTLDGESGAEILLVADRSEIVSLRGVAWPD